MFLASLYMAKNGPATWPSPRFRTLACDRVDFLIDELHMNMVFREEFKLFASQAIDPHVEL